MIVTVIVLRSFLYVYMKLVFSLQEFEVPETEGSIPVVLITFQTFLQLFNPFNLPAAVSYIDLYLTLSFFSIVVISSRIRGRYSRAFEKSGSESS